MTAEETAKLRGLTESQFWQPLVGKMRETVNELHRRSLNADTKEEAELLLHEARAAQKFSFSFITAVESDAQGE